MAASQTLVSLSKPTEVDYTSVSNFVWNEKPLISAEYGWVYQKEDLVSLCQARDDAWLDVPLEKGLKWFDGPIVQVSCIPLCGSGFRPCDQSTINMISRNCL